MRDFYRNKAIVTWWISTFDRTKPEPFPLETRHYSLDLATLDPPLAQEIYDALERTRSHKPSTSMPALSKGWTVTVDSAPRPPDFGFLKYRHLFQRRSDVEMEALLSDRTVDSIQTLSPNLAGEYFENEDGTPTTMQQMFEHLHPGTRPLIMFDVESVLKIGPTVPRDTNGWDSASADTISHCLYVIEKITASRWFHSPLSITFTDSQQGAPGTILEYVGADRPSTFEILSLVRQLYSSDDLYNKAINLYMRHLSNDGKREWIKQAKRMFNECRDGTPVILPVPGFTRRKLIDTFMYGARVMHAQADAATQSDLTFLLSTLGRERFMMAVLASMRELAGWASLSYHPVKQDFTFWTTDCKMDLPTRPDVDKLFGA